MEKQIYSYKSKLGSFNVLKLCTEEYPKIKEFWDGEDKTDYPFVEHTEDLIKELEGIVKSKD